MSQNESQLPLRTTCIIGGPASGKTTELIKRAIEAYENSGERVLIVCASRKLADDAKDALGADAALSEIFVTTPTELALEILGSGVAEANGREARLLNRNEVHELLSSLRRVGTRDKRLKELTAFLLRGLSDMSDDDEGWLITAEEVAVMKLLREGLAEKGGYLKCEVAAEALRGFRRALENAAPEQEKLEHDANGEAADSSSEFIVRHTYDTVLVDDYLSLGRASQLLACAVALRELVIACDAAPDLNARLDDEYPNAGGLDEFLKSYPDTKTEHFDECHCAPEIAKAITDLRAGHNIAALPDAINSPDSAISLSAQSTLGGEMEFIANTVGEAIESGISESKIFIAGTNKTWRANLSRAISLRLEKNIQINIDAPEKAYGRHFDLVILGGVVGGFLPTHGICSNELVGDKLKRAKDADTRAICACLASAKKIILTSFEYCDLETAERLNLSVKKIRFEKGQRRAQIQKSLYLA